MKALTEKQSDVYCYMKLYASRNGFYPSHKDIMEKFNWASPNAVQKHLVALRKKGWIEKIGNRAYKILK